MTASKLNLTDLLPGAVVGTAATGIVWIPEAASFPAAVRLGSVMSCVGGGEASALPGIVLTGMALPGLSSIPLPYPERGVPLILSSRACKRK